MHDDDIRSNDRGVMNMMRYSILVAALCVGQAFAQTPSPAAAPPDDGYDAEHAAQTQRALSECLVRSTSEEDRRALVAWIFMVVSHHPDVRSMVALGPKDEERIGRQASAVFETLLADRCAPQIRAAARYSGTEAIKQSFQYLGETAMGTLLEHPDVTSTVKDSLKYADESRIDRALQGE